MSSTTPATSARLVGAYLFLRPEDVAQDRSAGFYAEVTLQYPNDLVVVEPLDASSNISVELIPLATAKLRQVPHGEPTAGRRSEQLLRKGVACEFDGKVHFGQVVDVSDLGVKVNLAHGPLWANSTDVVATVPPLMAILLAGRALDPANWTSEDISHASAALDICMDDPATSPPTLRKIIDSVCPRTALHVYPDGLGKWVDFRGVVRRTSVAHAILYTFYVGKGREVPPLLQSKVGESIGDDPLLRSQASTESIEPVRSTQLLPSSTYLASETSFDAEEQKCEEPTPAALSEAFLASMAPIVSPAETFHVQHPTQSTPSDPLPPAKRARVADTAGQAATALATANASLTAEKAVAELGALLVSNPRAHELFRMIVNSGIVAPSAHVDLSKRNRSAFTPHDAQLIVHDAIVHPNHRGKSPTSFVHQQLSSSAVPFPPYPAVLVLLFDFGFGKPGLRFMHCGSLPVLERMEQQLNNTINMNDFSTGAKLPVVPRPTAWAVLQEAMNNLVVYCNEYTDEVTAGVVRAASAFLSSMQALGHWPPAHLDVLEYWVNERFAAYRSLVDSDARYGGSSRRAALEWFTVSNPSLVPFQNLIIQRDMEALRGPRVHATAVGGDGGHRPHQGAAPSRAVPPEVTSIIPKQGGQELCLRFASRKGCRTSGDSCTFAGRTRGHFVVPSLPRKVKAFIEQRFGGLSADYSK